MTTPTPFSDAARWAFSDTQAIPEYLAGALPPLVQAIDGEGLYPREVMTGLGRLGGFGAAVPVASTVAVESAAAVVVDPARQLHAIAAVGRHCGSTAFLAWCQSACAWYLAKAPQEEPRRRYLASVLDGSLLAGTGMSNFLKHHAGIEKIRLQARASADGYVVSGVLPWVSNLDAGHQLFTAAAVEGGGYIMFTVSTDAPGLALHPCPEFSGMEGTGTWNVRMNEVAVPGGDVLAEPAQFADFISAVKPGLVLTQAGMGLGVIGGCLDILEADRTSDNAVNQFLDTDAGDICEALIRLENEALRLTALVVTGAAVKLPVLKLRAGVSELSLKAAQSTALHMGARGYLMRHPAQRRLREAMFVAIVTPALKHLRKEIHDIEQNREVA